MTKPAQRPKTRRPKTPARRAHDLLIASIRAFEGQLNAAEEIAMGFAGDEAGILRIEGIGYQDPDIVTFYGTDDTGARTQLIQHVSQLSVTLRAVSRIGEADPPRRIGFRLTSGWTGGDAGDASA